MESAKWIGILGTIGFILSLILVFFVIYLSYDILTINDAIRNMEWEVIDGDPSTNTVTLTRTKNRTLFIDNNTQTSTAYISSTPAWLKNDELVIKSCSGSVSLLIDGGITYVNCSTGNTQTSQNVIESGTSASFIFTDKNQMIRIN